MGFRGKLPDKEVVAEMIMSAIRNGQISDEDLEKGRRAIEEYETIGPYVKQEDICKREHGFWECPSCGKIPGWDTPADQDFCPFCGYKLLAEEVEAQKERMARVKKVY